MIRAAALSLILFTACSALAGQDFSVIYKNRYIAALQMLSQIRPDFITACRIYNSDIEILSAVVFPEIMRYSVIRDKMERTSLNIFYVPLGGRSVDYSIGLFQMKPSFVDKMEELVSKYKLPGFAHVVIDPLYSSEKKRKTRLERLSRLDWQLVYLCCFYRLVSARFSSEIGQMNMEKKIRFFASAYNTGLDKDFNSISGYEDRAFYPGGSGPVLGQQYRYGDVSVFYWKKDGRFSMAATNSPVKN